MEALKRVFKGALIWLVAMLAMYLIFSSIYPTGSEMPIIFSFFILVLPIFCAVKFSKGKKNKKAQERGTTATKKETKPVQIEAQKQQILHFPDRVDAPTQNERKYEVVIVRKKQIQSAAKTYQIFLDGIPVGKLPNGGTIRFGVSPGNHKIAFKGYLRIEEFFDISANGQGGTKRLYATISLKTGKIIVEDATGQEFDSIFSVQRQTQNRSTDHQSLSQKPSRQSGHRSVAMARIDKMEGHEFERFTADLLRKLGYERVEVTPGSGDQGVDVIAVRDGKRYAIQCKRYSQKLGNKPVQEVFAGKTIYGCSVAVVLTNNYFTDGAKEAAKATGVELWDRDVLRRMMDYANYKAIV